MNICKYNINLEFIRDCDENNTLNMKLINYLKYAFGVLLCIFCLTSCSHEGRHNSNLPPYMQNVECKPVIGESTLTNASSIIRRPGQLWIHGDSLMILDVYDDRLYSLISISGDSLVSRFGKRGNGPDELLRPSLIQIDNTNQVYVYDDGKQLMHTSSLSKLTTDLDTCAPLNFKDMSGGFLSRTLTGYIGDRLYGDGHVFSFYDNSGNLIEGFGAIPDTEIPKEANPDFYMAYQVQFIVSPDKKYLCAMGLYHDWLAFFDVSGDRPKLIKEYFSTHPVVEASGENDNYHLSPTENSFRNYWAATSFDDGLFINYIGATQKDFDNGDFQNHLLKCKWNGDIEKCYEVNEKIGSIASTSDGTCVYGVVLEPEDDNKIFYKYTNL